MGASWAVTTMIDRLGIRLSSSKDYFSFTKSLLLLLLCDDSGADYSIDQEPPFK